MMHPNAARSIEERFPVGAICEVHSPSPTHTGGGLIGSRGKVVKHEYYSKVWYVMLYNSEKGNFWTHVDTIAVDYD